MRLIGMIQKQLQGVNQGGQINIQDNAFDNNLQIDQAKEARRRNFFEKKRFINYSYNQNPADDESSDNGAN